ncbi:fumarylacetoacetate hydrolase family protein [Saccharopolyspora hattusasensis]|uniref:fumarylacetoacetate hydrolase family protein n=1 Tax=Saccharopolyspora hattusasensis TaxID=1128679 RepID=UPI003D9700F5
MRLGTFHVGGGESLLYQAEPGAPWCTASPGLAELTGGAPMTCGAPVDDLEPAPRLPFRPRTIFGIGLNYHDTVAEMGWQTPEVPYLFPKLSSSAIGDGEAVVVDTTLSTRVDWETELAVIIGRRARHVPAEKALDVVFGYTVANDISARDLQAEDGQWVRGKGLDTFCPLGPVVVTADEVPDPQALGVRTWVNGEQVQDGSTADMIFDVRALIAYLSSFFTLEPGDVILTGTPAGCGDFRTPRLALRPGDRLESEVEGIGRLVNPVVAPDRTNQVVGAT